MSCALPPPPSPIAIVGASARAAAASARRAGYEPVAADLFADQDLCRIAIATRINDYPYGLLAWLRDTRPAAWLYTGALENYPNLVDAMAAVSPLLGNGGRVLRRVRSPWNLAAELRTAGLSFPETRRSFDGLPRDGSWLAKTCRGASGSGVRALNIPLSLAEGLTDGTYVFQQRVAGIPCAALFVASRGTASLLGITRQLVGASWLGAGEFQYCGSIGPWPVDDVALAAITRIGRVLADRFGLAGLFGVDVMIDGPHVWTIEVNPRYIASVEIVERATGIRAVEDHLVACGYQKSGDLRAGTDLNGGRRSQPLTPHHACHGKAVLFAKQDVVASADFIAWATGRAPAAVWPPLADVPQPNTAIAAGRPILTAFAAGATDDDVQKQLQARVAGIERWLYAGAGAKP